MNIRITCEYSGEVFSGWQFQPKAATVQGELENALIVFTRSQAKRLRLPPPERIIVYGSGRTDAGVSAKAQVANFVIPDELKIDLMRLQDGLNALTPRELVIKKIEEVGETFNARLSPHIKCYSYKMVLREYSAGYYKNRAWCVGNRLNIAKMIVEARKLKGQHDFASFRSKDCMAKTTVRTIFSSEIVRVSDEELVYIACGKGFLKNMIRIVVGTLVEIGKGNIDSIDAILRGQDRSKAGITAPACGLTLEWVRYL